MEQVDHDTTTLKLCKHYCQVAAKYIYSDLVSKACTEISLELVKICQIIFTECRKCNKIFGLQNKFSLYKLNNT